MRHLFWILIGVLLCGGAWAKDAAVGGITNQPVLATSAKDSPDEDVVVSVPEPSAKALQRYQTGNLWYCVWVIWGMVVPLVILFSGFSARLRDAAKRMGRKWYFILCLYLLGLVVVNYLVTLPLSYYLGFVRAHAYGLSNQTFGKWFGDSLKQLLLLYAAQIGVGWVPYLLLKKSPQRWWLYAALAMVPVYFFGMLIEPVVVDPLFNHVTRVENAQLETKILALAERAGIHGSRVYEIKKSVDTKTVNAYVTGFLGTKRIVLWDNAINKLTERELLFVMGHEMGHFALGHVVKGIWLVSALTLLALYGIHRTAGVLLARSRERFGFTELSDFASVPLFVLLVNLFSLVLTPVGFAYSRHIEHEADRFGLEITHFNHSAATGFARLQEGNVSVPRPGWLYMILRGTHPAIGDRIDFFNSYKPWEHGEPMKYEKYFQPEPPEKSSITKP
jgi:STE24 endopeptidase